MVTLLGFFFIIGNVGLLELTDPDLLSPKQAWVCYSYAFGVWAYSTMDNIDGKQARRTGTSSGLGELFDHGIDSLNCTLASLLETSAMGLGATRIGAFTALVPTLPMFFSTWETYHTHTLYLGYFNGPTEGLIVASAIMIVSGMYGPQIWREPLSDFLGFEQVLRKATMMDIWLPLILVSFFVAHLPSVRVQCCRGAAGEEVTFARAVPGSGRRLSCSSDLWSPGLDRLIRTCWPTTILFCSASRCRSYSAA